MPTSVLCKCGNRDPKRFIGITKAHLGELVRNKDGTPKVIYTSERVIFPARRIDFLYVEAQCQECGRTKRETDKTLVLALAAPREEAKLVDPETGKTPETIVKPGSKIQIVSR